MALYGTLARSPHAAVAPSNANPAHKYAGRSWIKNIAQVSATASPVNTLRASRRRRGDPTHTPTSGASSATVNPASAPARPNQLSGVVLPGMPTPTLLVR